MPVTAERPVQARAQLGATALELRIHGLDRHVELSRDLPRWEVVEVAQHQGRAVRLLQVANRFDDLALNLEALGNLQGGRSLLPQLT